MERMGGSFAYRIGYYDENGRYRQSPDSPVVAAEPMMADKPSYELPRGSKA